MESKQSFPIRDVKFFTKSLKSFDRIFISGLLIESLHNVSNFSFGSFFEKYMRQKLSVFSFFKLYICSFSGLTSKIL